MFQPKGIERRKAGSAEVEYYLSLVGGLIIAGRDITRGVVGFKPSSSVRFKTIGDADGGAHGYDVTPSSWDITLSLAPNSEARILLDEYIAITNPLFGKPAVGTYISLMVFNHTTGFRHSYLMGGLNHQSGDPVDREGQGTKDYELKFLKYQMTPF